VWLADILHASMGCCKRLLRVVALVSRNGKARKGVVGGILKDPAAKAGPFSRLTRLPAAPAVDDARLDPGIILSGACKVSIEILDLDQSQGDMLRHLVISAASQRHRE